MTPIITDFRTIYKNMFGKEDEMYQKYCALRDKTGVTDYRVAKDLDITASTFTDWKNGRSNPGVEKLSKIAKYFAVPIEYFLEKES